MGIFIKDPSNPCGSLILSMEPPTSRGKSLTFASLLRARSKEKSSTPSSSTPLLMMSTSPQEAKAPNSMAAKFVLARESKSLAASLPVQAASPRGQFETDTQKFVRPLTKVTATSGSLEALRLNSLILQLAASTECGSDASIFGISQPGHSWFRKQAV